MIETQIISWYKTIKRDLPWRETTDFYSVWISEIMLQQTRVNQMIGYYSRFMNAFPTLVDLAKASEDLVLKNWEGLGYYSRARNLHFTAQYIVNELNNVPPTNFDTLKKLKGIGDYTAAAIASICYDEPKMAVDGNVFRVFARYFLITNDIAIPKTKTVFFELGNAIISQTNPGDFNQGIMELGATICLPKNPDCTNCPLNNSCLALAQGKINLLPVKNTTIKVQTRYLNYFVINKTLIFQQRTAGIWKNLYELPLLETKEALAEIKDFDAIPVQTFQLLRSQTHKLTHRLLHIRFWAIEIENTEFEHLANGKTTSPFSKNIPYEYAFPKPIVNFLEEHN